MNVDQFTARFALLTGTAPFPWQTEVYKLFSQGVTPSNVDLPTGLGKTSIIAVWLITLALHPGKLPRRLVYVVNRRTVVDQTTEEIKKLRANLVKAGVDGVLRELCALPLSDGDAPLAVSTLRGALAEDRAWCADPCRPAVVAGTVDLIASRLLFSGYRAGFKTRPLFAGFLGQDTLIINDESHLEPACQKLLAAIAGEQARREDASERDARSVRIMALSATRRGEKEETDLELSAADEAHPIVAVRLRARKRLALHPLDDPKQLAETLAGLALRHEGSDRAVIIYARRVTDVEEIRRLLRARLPREHQNRLAILIGPMRGFEREKLVETDQSFRRFLPPAMEADGTDIPPLPGTFYLVCTSAGEVGVNLSADHLVCDLTPYESMAQRFGRVNRFGKREDTEVDVVCLIDPKEDEDYKARLHATKALLERLDGDASPAALRALNLTSDERKAAFSKEPEILQTSDILFDAWTLTSVRDALPGRPPVKPYLHGKEEGEPPATEIAWREEVGVIVGKLIEKYPPRHLLDAYPLKPREILRDRSDRVWKHLDKMAQRDAVSPVWIVDEENDSVEPLTLEKLLTRRERNKECIDGCTVLLRPDIGGLDDGMLSGSSVSSVDDVADSPKTEVPRSRFRLWDIVPGENEKVQLVQEIRLRDEIDDEAGDAKDDDEKATPARQVWRWYELPARADAESSRYARKEVLLKDHNRQVERHARSFAEKLGLSADLIEAVGLAGKFHDVGKGRPVWQQSIGNYDPSKLLAKSGRRAAALAAATDYRHEWGSLLDLLEDTRLTNLSEEMRDVALHLIAAHHGRARPHFEPAEMSDAKNREGFMHPKSLVDALAAETPRRFARLQRRYGRWGLAFLESLLRAADYAASAKPDGTEEEKQ